MVQDDPHPPFQGRILPLEPAHRAWLRQLWRERWGGDFVISRGQVHHASDLPGYLAVVGGEPVGAVTVAIQEAECEIVSLDSLVEEVGAGSALIEMVRQAAESAGCSRLWLVTTNDNLPALRFYQRRGFRLAAVHAGALEQTRRLKPSLPLTGLDGIPLRDEIELEMQLNPAKTPVTALDTPDALPASAIQPGIPSTSAIQSDPSAAPLPGGSGYAQPGAAASAPNPAGTRLARRILYASPYLNLYLDHMRTPSGREIPDYHLVDYPNAAVAMVITNDRGEVLLGRYPRYTIGQVRWEVPAGGVEPGEDLLAAAQREVYEETGYTTRDLRHYYSYHPAAGSSNKVFHLIRGDAGERTGDLDPHEVAEIGWFSVSALKQMIRRQEIQDGYTLTALLIAWELGL